MKIAHLPFTYYPDPVGGTEVYVQALAQEQKRRGHDVSIIAPGRTSQSYEHEGLPVHRYGVANDVDVDEVWVRRNSVDVDAFVRTLARDAVDVLHVHGLAPAVTREMMTAARQQGCRTVFTYHTATATCMRGTLLRWGSIICDGRLTRQRCAACVLQQHGLPRPAAEAVSLLHVKKQVPGAIGTALRMRTLVEARHAEIERFLADVDRVVAPAEWVRTLLLRIGVDSERIFMSRQGVFATTIVDEKPRDGETVRLAFLGRMDPTKGLNTIINALAHQPELPIQLDIFPTVPLNRVFKDARVRAHDPLPQRVVLDELQRYHALVVPSQTLETGPLVVLEAFEAGIPVIGSRIGGIAELVDEGRNGILIDPRDKRAWREVLRRIVAEPALLRGLRNHIRKPRTMSDVADDMERAYA